MKSKVALLLTLALWQSACAESARFFRVAGPVATTITALGVDGSLTWTNAPTNTTFTVQTALSLVGSSNWVDYLQVLATNAATTDRLFDPNPPAGMVLIPAGTFTMGDTFNERPAAAGERPVHTVYVSAFYMDKYEMTKPLWDDVYLWAINHGYGFDNAGLVKDNLHPVQTVNWFDCVKWCNARSEKEGLVPAYYTNGAQTVVYRNGQRQYMTNGCVNWAANGYRLPTEAEWEKAARGGLSGQRFPWGDTISWSNANYYSYPLPSSGGFSYDLNPTGGVHSSFSVDPYPYTSPAGYFAPNGYGVYDMAGNVAEWCWDWFLGYYSGYQTDPHGYILTSERVIRGGSWASLTPASDRVAVRDSNVPNTAIYFLGFRCVRVEGP